MHGRPGKAEQQLRHDWFCTSRRRGYARRQRRKTTTTRRSTPTRKTITSRRVTMHGSPIGQLEMVKMTSSQKGWTDGMGDSLCMRSSSPRKASTEVRQDECCSGFVVAGGPMWWKWVEFLQDCTVVEISRLRLKIDEINNNSRRGELWFGMRWPWWRWQRPALARRRRQNRRRCSLWSSRWCWRRLQRMLLVFGETMTNVHVTKQKRSRSSAHFEDSGETVPACSVAEAAPIRAALPSAGAG